MSRAAILPYPGDPFLLNYWLDNFFKYWAFSVDKLYVVFNSPIEPQVVEYVEYLCDDPKIDLTYIDHQIEHGDAIRVALEKATEDYVVLVEDDSFVMNRMIMDKCFMMLESGEFDVVGSKRGSCSFEILKAAENKWGIPWRGEGDQGCNFWPCFFFSKRQLLLDTDRHFSARAWNNGETIAPLGYVVEVPVLVGDTFVNTSLQIHDMVPESRICYVPQYHGSPEDMDNFEKRQYLFDGSATWTHIGSLSSGVGGILRDGNNRALARRLIDPPEPETKLPSQWCQSEGEHREFERRVQWWLTFWENRQHDEIEEFAQLYHDAIYQIIRQFGLSETAIKKRQLIYQTLGL